MASKAATKPLEAEVPSLYITDTAAHTGDFFAIKCLATAVATLASPTMAGTLTSVPLVAGDTLYGRFTSITLASGKVVAYNNR